MDVEISLYEPVHLLLVDVFQVTLLDEPGYCGRIAEAEELYESLPIGSWIGFNALWPERPISIPCLESTPVRLYKCAVCQGRVKVVERMIKGSLISESQRRIKVP
jgi:hypothetical protein